VGVGWYIVKFGLVKTADFIFSCTVWRFWRIRVKVKSENNNITWVKRAATTTVGRIPQRYTRRCIRSARLNVKLESNGPAWRSISRRGKTTRTSSPVGLLRNTTRKGEYHNVGNQKFPAKWEVVPIIRFHLRF